MEFLHGQTLAQLLIDSTRRLSTDLIAQGVDDVGRARVAMHAASLIHRDLKPENIMLVDSADSITPGEDRKRFKIIDFGISSKTDALDSQRNATFDGAGTPEYMAPEQLMSAPVSSQADIYAQGVLMFLLYSGRVPFQATAPSVSGLADLVECVLYEPAPPLSNAVSADVVVPAKLDRLVADCLAKNPADRPASPAEVCLRYREATQERHLSATLQRSAKHSTGRSKETGARRIAAITLFSCIVAVAMMVWLERPPTGDVAVPNRASNEMSVLVPSTNPASKVVADKSVAEVAEALPPHPDADSTPDGIPLMDSANGSNNETDVAAAHPMTETEVQPVQKSILWCPSVFEPTGDLTTSENLSLASTLRLKDPEIVFVLVTPETLTSVRASVPKSSDLRHQHLRMRGLFSSTPY